MDKDRKEKDRLYQWACRYGEARQADGIFTRIEPDADSYYTERDGEGDYLCEYGFQSLPELRDRLEAMWKDDSRMGEIMTAVLAGAYKNQIEPGGESKAASEVSGLQEISPYIYSF